MPWAQKNKSFLSPKLSYPQNLESSMGLSLPSVVHSINFEVFCRKDVKKIGVLSRCVQRLIAEHVLKHSCKVGGHFLSEPRHAVCALAYMDRSWHIYQRVCTPRRKAPHEPTFTMRQFLFFLKVRVDLSFKS